VDFDAFMFGLPTQSECEWSHIHKNIRYDHEIIIIRRSRRDYLKAPLKLDINNSEVTRGVLLPALSSIHPTPAPVISFSRLFSLYLSVLEKTFIP
jgi:hypothetical protein